MNTKQNNKQDENYMKELQEIMQNGFKKKEVQSYFEAIESLYEKGEIAEFVTYSFFRESSFLKKTEDELEKKLGGRKTYHFKSWEDKFLSKIEKHIKIAQENTSDNTTAFINVAYNHIGYDSPFTIYNVNHKRFSDDLMENTIKSTELFFEEQGDSKETRDTLVLFWTELFQVMTHLVEARENCKKEALYEIEHSYGCF